jgi:hypothetical protein
MPGEVKPPLSHLSLSWGLGWVEMRMRFLRASTKGYELRCCCGGQSVDLALGVAAD